MELPVIIIAAYNRPKSLNRLLFSLDNAEFEVFPKLIISIDGGGSSDVVEVAKNYRWKGEKELIIHEENKGLKKHILFCGDLTEKYNDIILLEEDLFVSRFFYNYAKEALYYYNNNQSVAGISLYQYEYIEADDLPFKPLVDGYDTYFIQTASSWGQAWNKKQWQGFKRWYKNNEIWDDKDSRLPADVLNWPETSWKKYFIKYLVETDKYFVFPRISLSTNCGDAGTNNSYKNTLHQVNFLIGAKKWDFAPRDKGILYNAFFNVLNLENLRVKVKNTTNNLELIPLELNITEGLSPLISNDNINDLKSKTYKKQYNLSYKVIKKIQNELPSLRLQVLTQTKYWLIKKLIKWFR